ncbi:MAG TPA: nuclear transport factor 2 family protein [Chitinophagales bacterium]|nr:nuclear transport factor 2 family protein [Chitinophagales bacterium]
MTTITATDFLGIQNLISRYTLTTDNADANGFMECWVTPEEFGGYDSGAFGNMKTWQELYEFEKHHVGPGGSANGNRHQVTNLLIEPVSEKEVHVTHDMLVIKVSDIPHILATGRYDKSLVVKTDKGWKFKSRSLKVDDGFFKLMEQWKQAETSN